MGGRGAESGKGTHTNTLTHFGIRDLEIDAQRRLNAAQRPGEYFNRNYLTKFEDILVEYTGGGMSFSPEMNAKIKGVINDMKSSTTTLYRVEENRTLKDIKVGQTFKRDIQSFSKSKRFVTNTLDGNDDIDYDNPVVIKITGKQKSLNIQGYSGFTDQAESLAYGKYKIKKNFICSQ